ATRKRAVRTVAPPCSGRSRLHPFHATHCALSVMNCQTLLAHARMRATLPPLRPMRHWPENGYGNRTSFDSVTLLEAEQSADQQFEGGTGAFPLGAQISVKHAS